MSEESIKHYGYGSGMSGCLYDNGPHYGGTNKVAVAESALFIFKDEMSESEYKEAISRLCFSGIHYFDNPSEVGAQVVEIFEVDPADYADEIED